MDDFDRSWRDLAAALSLKPATTEVVLRRLRDHYSEPARHYHTATHITAMLTAAEAFTFDHPEAVTLAIFFHDLIYDPARSDNETRSAETMTEWLAAEVPVDILTPAVRMIEATQKHQPSGDPDTDLLVDLDMAILGQPWPVYERYAKGVMAEYIPVYGEDAYRQGRIKLFLDPVLEHGVIFLTPAFADLDAKALDNLRREKAWLASGA